jgi:hypothetical protein
VQIVKISFWHKASFVVLAAGIVLLFHPVQLLSYFAYPILAWSILGILDALNVLKWKSSLMTADCKLFWGSMVPVSLMFWLFFEYLNLLYSQWIYLDAPSNKATATILTALSFSTVIPLVIEVLWYFIGPVEDIKLPENMRNFISSYRRFFPVFAIALLAGLLVVRTFWTIQAMWFIPFFLFISFTPTAHAAASKLKSFHVSIVVAALLSGLIWETINYRATTKWVYLLLPKSPHLFEMPLPGYLGYVPFAFSVLAVYLWARTHLGYTLLRACILYCLALVVSYIFVVSHSAVFHP